jgi:hypothetical protein
MCLTAVEIRDGEIRAHPTPPQMSDVGTETPVGVAVAGAFGAEASVEEGEQHAVVREVVAIIESPHE